MSSPTGWMLSACASVTLLLGVSAALTPESRQEVKSATKAANKAADGPAKPAWQRLDMSKPAIDKGIIYMAHPADTGRPQKPTEFHPRPASPGGSHRLLAADLSTGRHIWEQEISGDVITAPVISDGTVYFTTFDGTSYALNAADGSVVWVKANAATSAPVIAGGQLYETRKTLSGKDTIEGLARVDAKQGNARDKELIAKRKADYLKQGSGGGGDPSAQAAISLQYSTVFR